MPEEPSFVVMIPIDILQLLLKEVQQLRDKVSALEVRQDLGYEQIAGDICNHGQRIKKLESAETKEPSRKVAEHLDEIAKALLAREKQCRNTSQKWDFMAFWEVEELLGLSHRRVSQLANLARNDPRFAIGWHPKRRNMKVFRLNRFA